MTPPARGAVTSSRLGARRLVVAGPGPERGVLAPLDARCPARQPFIAYDP